MILYTILSYLGSDYFIFMGVWSGGRRRKIFHQKKSGPNFSRKKYLQDRVNSIVLFAFLQIKRQNRVAGENNSGLKTSYIFYC